jgi:hypothetical protein
MGVGSLLRHYPVNKPPSIPVRVPAIDSHYGFLPAIRRGEYSVENPQGIEVWKYDFPLVGSWPVEEIQVRYGINPPGSEHGSVWTGVFKCAPARHVEVIPWAKANAVVIAAANAVYIVDPEEPSEFTGVAAPVEITGITFDESGEHMFVADSLRIYAFTSDRHFKWISEPLEGYGAKFCGCGGRVLAVEVTPAAASLESDESPAPVLLRLRTEDGTILRSRFRRVNPRRRPT